MKRPRVLLADDHTLVADGLRRILEPECEVVGAVEDGRSLLAAAEQLNPDIILLDISIPLLNGVDAARRLRDAVPKTALPWRRTTIGSTASTRPRRTRI